MTDTHPETPEASEAILKFFQEFCCSGIFKSLDFRYLPLSVFCLSVSCL